VGYEINPKFTSTVKNKLKVSEHSFFGDATYEFIHQQSQIDDATIANLINSLPYKFSDPHKLDKKIDPRVLKFGSKIQQSDNGENVELYSVTEVISPEILRLNNGLTLRLIGVAEEPSRREQAVTFLTEKTRGERVFLRFDKIKYDDAGNLLSYVYLKNKTFLNAHLIKGGFVSVDTSQDYKYRHKFQNLLTHTNA
jgi:site-specific DNA-methyltransferase (adenine-specific)